MPPRVCLRAAMLAIDATPVIDVAASGVGCLGAGCSGEEEEGTLGRMHGRVDGWRVPRGKWGGGQFGVWQVAKGGRWTGECGRGGVWGRVDMCGSGGGWGWGAKGSTRRRDVRFGEKCDYRIGSHRAIPSRRGSPALSGGCTLADGGACNRRGETRSGRRDGHGDGRRSMQGCS